MECECLLKSNWPDLYPPEIEEDHLRSPEDFVRHLAAGSKRKHEETAMRTKYVDCTHLSATTVKVESLFSQCSRVMTADRQRMHMPSCISILIANGEMRALY
jgi:hypothetical protein